MDVLGIDVSHHNGPLDWACVRRAGYRFAFVKATQGASFVDPMLERHVAGASAAGLRVGAYHFLDSQEDGQVQARHFLAALASLRGKLTLPCVVDVEADPRDGKDGWGSVRRKEAVDRLSHYLQEVDDAFRDRTIVYTSPGWWRGVFGNADFSQHPLWAARYGGLPNLAGTCWRRWLIHQFEEHGRIPGISGEFDLDRWEGDPTFAL